MNEVRRIDSDSSDFSFYNLDDYKKVSQINPESKLKKIEKRGVVIYYMDDFLLYPHQFINFLKKFPAFSNNARGGMYRPGMSQKFHSELFRHFERLMCDISPVSNVAWCSNIFNSDMYCPNDSWKPHHDVGTSFVSNYWMCEQEGRSGTMFYTWNGKTTIDQEGEVLLKDKMHLHDKYVPGKTWRNVNPKDIEGLNAVYFTPVKFNRIVFYDANQLHSPYITKNTYLKNNYRYSLVGFGFK
jgi:hypothetical protein